MTNLAAIQAAAFIEMAAAVTAGDAARYARLYAEDAVITIHGGETLRGRTAIEQYEVALLRQFPGTRLAFYDLWQEGPAAVVHYGVSGKAGDGRAMGHEGLLFYRFLPSGLIAEERRYNDSLTPMAQLGALGPVSARPVPALPAELKAHTVQNSSLERDNVALVATSLRAVDARDRRAFLATLAPGATVDELMFARPFDDPAAWFDTWTHAVDDASSQITFIRGVGNAVLVEMMVRGALRGPLGPLHAADKPFAVHRALIVQIANGKIERISAFMNGKELAEATGQWPPRQTP